MPFTSKSQLSTCYGAKNPGWNCNEMLRSTSSVCALPSRSGSPKKNSPKVAKRSKSRVQTGPRGGKFFIITERNAKGNIICETKVYVRGDGGSSPKKGSKKKTTKKTSPKKTGKKKATKKKYAKSCAQIGREAAARCRLQRGE
jgi:hypothetical protein